MPSKMAYEKNQCYVEPETLPRIRSRVIQSGETPNPTGAELVPARGTALSYCSDTAGLYLNGLISNERSQHAKDTENNVWPVALLL